MGSLPEPVHGIRIAIDRGGTFTDVSNEAHSDIPLLTEDAVRCNSPRSR